MDIKRLVPYTWNPVTKNNNSNRHDVPNALQTTVKALISGLSGLVMIAIFALHVNTS